MPTNPPHLRPPEIDSRSFLRHYARPGPPPPHHPRLKKRRGEAVSCLQIGANDGVTNDPLHRYLTRHGWRGLLLEPLGDGVHNELRHTYSGSPRVILENVARADSEGSLPLYRVAISNARWATGL